MVSSILPVMAAAAPIPSQSFYLTYSPIWTVALFATALVLACGLMWTLRTLERSSRNADVDRKPLTLAFPHPRRHAVAGAGHHGA